MELSLPTRFTLCFCIKYGKWWFIFTYIRATRWFTIEYYLCSMNKPWIITCPYYTPLVSHITSVCFIHLTCSSYKVERVNGYKSGCFSYRSVPVGWNITGWTMASTPTALPFCLLLIYCISVRRHSLNCRFRIIRTGLIIYNIIVLNINMNW